MPLIDNSSMNKQNKNGPAEKQKTEGKAMKGFAVMSASEVKRIARMGGLAISKNRKWMRDLGAKGGAARVTSQATKNAKDK